jgi:hypothetical protein
MEVGLLMKVMIQQHLVKVKIEGIKVDHHQDQSLLFQVENKLKNRFDKF